MLDDYKDSQPILYYMLKNACKLNRLSHAYLIDGNNFRDIDMLINSFVKLLVCPFSYTNDSLCGNCNICNRIDDGNYTEIRIIKPQGISIKKEQLSQLQEDFSLSGLEGKRRVYIIRDCEKMNVQAANSILKFLEEPVDNIFAILVTNNIDSILSTIVSRCQIIKLYNESMYSDSTVDNVRYLINSCNVFEKIDNELIESYISSCFNFIKYFEDNKIDTIIYSKKLWYDIYNDRSSYLIGFNIIINFYYDVLKYKLNGNIKFFLSNEVDIVNIANKISVSTVTRRINTFIKYLELIKYNLNLNLLMDSLVMELGD